MKKTLPKGISRIDRDQNCMHGYISRVCFKGQTYSKLFYDGKYCSDDDALFAAIQWRDDMEKKVGKPRTERRVMAKGNNSNTGIKGVVRKIVRGMDVFEIRWSPKPNVSRKTTVSVRKYGEEGAFKKACEIRKKKEEQYYGIS